MHKKYLTTALMILTSVLFIKNPAWSQTDLLPPHIATDIKAERIKFSNDSIKISWKMNQQYTGDFIVGRSEKEISAPEDALQAKLIGIFNSTLDGILIDRDVQQGKKYYYIILAKELLLKRQIDIYKNINYTGDPVSLFVEPESVQSLRVDVSGDNKIIINWKKVKGSSIKYNVYRSRSAISSGGELEVAEKIATTEKNEFSDENIPDYGSYFYAVTITDKNGIEYFNPKSEQNFTSNGIYLKGKSLATPLNVDAFAGDKNSIIVKWEKSESRTGKDLQGYEIYRSDEIINSLLKLKFSKLIKIADSSTTIYTDKDLLPGKYYYAVFSRYSDGTVDINFDTDSNYTKSLLMITLPYKINALNHEIGDKGIIIRWNYTGNSGNDTVSIFRSAKIPSDSSSIMNDDIIGTENIKAGKFTINNPASGNFYYGVLCRNENEIVQIRKGINLTVNPIESSSDLITEKADKKERLTENDRDASSLSGSGLDNIIRNTYYKGNYTLALKELKNFIKTTDNKYDQSKARLFLAKSYIEMHEYEKSIRLLDNDDVKNAFPDETKFWFEFALVRLK